MAEVGALTTIAYKATSEGTYLPLATVQSIDGPGITVGEVESTLLSSTFKPYNSTLPEGELTITIQHKGVDAGVIALRAAVSAYPVPTWFWQITYPDGYTDTFQGFAKGYSVAGVESESIITADVPIRLTTAVVSAAPSS